MVERACVVCGETFKKSGTRIVCSDPCKVKRIAEKSRERRHGSKEILIKDCIICADRFVANGRSKTCGKKCSKERYRLYQNHHKRENTWGHRESKLRWRLNNPERYKKHQQDYRDRNPEIEAKRYIRNAFAIEPTHELVEEYAALYLLRRAIKNAGN